jgi:hypothetical protein
LTEDLETKLVSVQRAIECDPYISYGYNAKVRMLTNLLRNAPIDDKQVYADVVLEDLKKSIQIRPSLSNPAWGIWDDYIQVFLSPSDRKKAREELIDRMRAVDPEHPRYFDYRTDQLERAKDRGEAADGQDLVREIESLYTRKSLSEKRSWGPLWLQSATTLGLATEARKAVDALSGVPEIARETSYLLAYATYELKINRDLQRAIQVLWEELDRPQTRSIYVRLLELLRYANDADRCAQAVERRAKTLGIEEELESRLALAETQGRWEEALQYHTQLRPYRDGDIDIANRSHMLLKAGHHKQANEELAEYLDERNYDPSLFAEVVNYELSRKLLRKNPHKDRLSLVADYAPELTTIAACKMLQGNDDEALALLLQEYEHDFEAYYVTREWLVFQPLLTKLDGRVFGPKAVASDATRRTG